MYVHQLDQFPGYKQFTDWSNNAWKMGKSQHGKLQKAVNYYTTGEYTANLVTCYIWQ